MEKGDVMKEKQLEHSALLGRFVGMVQAMEDAMEGASPKKPRMGHGDFPPILCKYQQYASNNEEHFKPFTPRNPD